MSESPRLDQVMSRLKPRIAAGLAILALGGLAGVALSHPQSPPRTTQVQSAAAPAAHTTTPHAPAAFTDDEGGGADD
jgi:hypothetical protein